MDCVICSEKTYVRLLECCQAASEAKYMICRRCVTKSQICPLCRSVKILTEKKWEELINSLEHEHWLYVNMYLAVYIFLTNCCRTGINFFYTDDCLNKLSQLLLDISHPQDLLPGYYNVAIIP
jgi:hypothetical protein